MQGTLSLYNTILCLSLLAIYCIYFLNHVSSLFVCPPLLGHSAKILFISCPCSTHCNITFHLWAHPFILTKPEVFPHKSHIWILNFHLFPPCFPVTDYKKYCVSCFFQPSECFYPDRICRSVIRLLNWLNQENNKRNILASNKKTVFYFISWF